MQEFNSMCVSYLCPHSPHNTPMRITSKINRYSLRWKWWPFSSVSSFMSLHMFSSCEGLRTVNTGVRCLPSVNSHMSL